MKSVRALRIAVLLVVVASGAQAGETGHFSPGIANIRDYIVPEPGFYGILYNYMYTSDRLNDRNGDPIDQVTVPVPSGTATLDLDLDLDLYVASPGLMWSSDYKILGATFGAYTIIGLANSSLGAALTATTGSGRS